MIVLDAAARALLALGDPDHARSMICQLSKFETDDLRQLLTVFDLATAAGDGSTAALAVERLRSIEGENGCVWKYADGTTYLQRARSGDAQALDRASARAIELEERHREWWGTDLLLGQLAEQQNKPEEAVAHYFRVLEQSGDAPSVAQRLVALLLRMERYNDIDRLVQQLRSQGRDVSEIALIRAVAAIRHKDAEGGLARAREFLSEASNNPTDLLLLGRLYVLAGKLKEADRPLRRALELAPGSSDAWLSYIQLLALTDRRDLAARLADQAGKRLAPDLGLLVTARRKSFLATRRVPARPT